MSDLDQRLLSRMNKPSLDQRLARKVPGLSPENPIQEQHPKITDADRFNIMQLGGGGEGAARYLEAKGLEVDHQGGMYFSAREPGGKWMVVDPEHRWLSPSTWEPIQDVTDLAADVGSIASMGAGAAKGAAMGFPLGPPGIFAGAVIGAGAGGGASQLARAGYGKLAGIDQTGREIADDIGYEAAFGMGSEAIGIPAIAGIRRGVRGLRNLRGGRLTQARTDIESAIPLGKGPTPATHWTQPAPAPQMRTVWEIAEMTSPKKRAVGARHRMGPRAAFPTPMTPIPLEAGRPLVEIGGPHTRLVKGYDQKGLRTKLVREWFPELQADIRRIAAVRGVSAFQQVADLISSAIGAPGGARVQRLFNAVPIGLPPNEMFDELTAVLARGTIGASKQKEIAKRLAQSWGIETAGLTNKQIMRTMRRVMADDDFVYREAARKAGVPGAFSRDADLQQLVNQVWKYEMARTAVAGAGRQELIEAGIRGGPARATQKHPPWSEKEAMRAEDLASLLREESYLPGTKPGAPPRQKYPRTTDPAEIGRQEAEIIEAEYKRRVYGEVPEMIDPDVKTLGGPPYLEKPIVDLEARSQQMAARRAGVPWDKAKGSPRTGTSPGKPILHQGYPYKEFKPGVSHGGPQGGVIPRAEAVDFWRYLSVEDLTSLRIGGREIPLTQPQSQMVSRAIFRMAVSPRAASLNKILGKIANFLQTPKRLLKSTLEAWKMDAVVRFMTRPGVSGGLTGAGLGTLTGAGGLLGAAGGAALEIMGSGAAAVGRHLMRNPDPKLLGQLIQKALRQQSSRAHQLLTQAQGTLDDYGEDAFRAMIYHAMHEPQVRRVFEGAK